jgi:hypothetical protein
LFVIGGISAWYILKRRQVAFFRRSFLLAALGCPGRALIVDLILVHLTILGISFGLLAFESCEMAANFIGRKHTSHFGDKSRKLPGESRMLRGGAGEVQPTIKDAVPSRSTMTKAALREARSI